MLRVGVLVSGGGTNLQAIIDNCQSGAIDAEVVCVVSNKKNAYALTRAEKHNIPRYAERQEEEIAKILQSHKVSLVVTAGFMSVLSPDFVDKFRIINVHPSLIPSFCGIGYYGLNVHKAALLRGVKITGATVHFVDAGCDTGEIILQKAVEVLADDTPESLQLRVMELAERVILPKAIQMIAKGELR
ncbi:phosphoribosylglycinamide formyltransferase [Clostridia bacterium]|nr:phosphoribosylglycinamide formyltransferase [Clostridia bacterium]